MPIQFVCSECGQWLQTAEEDAGSMAVCPQCGEQSAVPDSSDRPLEEGTCFYCEAPLPAGETPPGPDEIPTCQDCLASIEENTIELELERRENDRRWRGMVALGLLAAGAIVLFLLISAIADVLRKTGRAPDRAPATLAGEPDGPLSGWLLAPGAPAPAG